MEMQKYVRHSKLGFILWSDMNDIWHKHIGEWIVARYGGKIISAGFVQVEPDTEVICFGKSESLGISSDSEDSELLKKQLGK